MEVDTDSADDAIVTVGQLSSLLQNYTAMSVRLCALHPTVLLEVLLVLACKGLRLHISMVMATHSACHELSEGTLLLATTTLSSPCPVLQYAQNTQGVLGWGIELLAIGVSQPTNTSTTLPCQNQFGK